MYIEKVKICNIILLCKEHENKQKKIKQLPKITEHHVMYEKLKINKVHV